ncbi:MAG: DoxX family membrane protein, partial [Candidatus Angelobacter sp.]
MKSSGGGTSSTIMALARVAVGIMFLFFAEYKIAGTQFAREGFTRWVSGWLQETSVGFYKPFLHWALQHPYISGYGTGIVELLIGLSMVVGFRVRIFSIIGALYMLNLTFATWNLPAGTPAWRYVGNELDHIPLRLLFL